MRLLSAREEQILLLLKRFDFMTRDQLNECLQLGTVRNTNRILHNLSAYLMNIREGYQTIYYLSSKGRRYVDCEKVRKKGGHVRHIVMRNEMWLFSNQPKEWKNEVKVSDGSTSIVVDAMFNDSWERKNFLEVDSTQPMKENRNKIQRYKELLNNGLVEEKLGHFPTLVWLTTTEHRREQLKKECEGLQAVMVFTINDIK